MSFQAEAVILEVAGCCMLSAPDSRLRFEPEPWCPSCNFEILGFSGQIPDPMKRYQASIVLKIAFTSLVQKNVLLPTLPLKFHIGRHEA